MGRTGGTRQVVNLVHLQHDGFGHVVHDQLEAGMVQPVLDVLALTGEEVVDYDHLVPLHHEFVRQVRPDKARAAGDQDLLALGVGEVGLWSSKCGGTRGETEATVVVAGIIPYHIIE